MPIERDPAPSQPQSLPLPKPFPLPDLPPPTPGLQHTAAGLTKTKEPK